MLIGQEGWPLIEELADRSEDYVEETLESAGCTGSCESFKDGLPECEKCSQFEEKKDE